jgi:DNA-binding transcriptional LysR family regulator
MDRLTEMEAFVRVVDHGGFTEAARRMRLSKSAVSKHVSALEARLAVRLLNRTTRRVSPTEVGLAYYDRARSVLAEAAEADSMVTAMQATPQGFLRLSAPISFGITQVSPAVARFLGEYPEVDIGMALDDRLVELLGDRPADPLGIFAVYPEGRFIQPKLRAFVDFMAEHFRGMGPDHWP